MHWRWQEDNVPGTPWGNMACDEALLEELSLEPSALPIIRVYRWDRPCVSIGRLQDEMTVDGMFPDLPKVRRPTGGRAVVHGEDITISFIAHDGDMPVSADRSVMSSYRRITGAIVEAFGHVGVVASLGEPGRSSNRTDTVDCFAVTARCDVIARESGRKLAGCAQRRQNGVILQQMSVPLSGVPDEQTFLLSVKDAFRRIAGVTVWVLVDTPSPV